MIRTMRAPLAALALLAACASPAPEFFGAPEVRVTRAGLDFAVFRRDDRAQAIRLDRIPARRQAGMPALLVQVTEEATGCTVRRGSIKGDTTEIRARLTC